MTNKKINLKTEPPGQESQPVISKYTYADLSNFHRTVLAILNHNIPNTLDVEDLKIVQQYLCTITAMLGTPYLYGQFAKESPEKPIHPYQSSSPPKPKAINTICRLKKCLKALIIWMSEVIKIENLTFEILLDGYYTKFPYALRPPALSETNHKQ